MKIINPDIEYINKDNLTPCQLLERVGRVCYKSEDKITDDSAEKFVRGLQKSGHLAILEHHWVHFTVPVSDRFLEELKDLVTSYMQLGSYTELTKFIEVSKTFAYYYISAPLRVFLELVNTLYSKGFSFFSILHRYSILNEVFTKLYKTYPYLDWTYKPNIYLPTTNNVQVFTSEDSFISNLSETLNSLTSDFRNAEIMKHRTHTFRIVCDRGVSHELVRHRVCSFAQESTRYCNYSKEKFGNEITVIKPYFFNRLPTTDDGVKYDDSTYTAWLLACEACERAYFRLLNKGATPQEARTVLPNSLKTEIVVTANETEWQHIVNLRVKGTTGKPHPQMVEVMTPAYERLKGVSNNRIK